MTEVDECVAMGCAGPLVGEARWYEGDELQVGRYCEDCLTVVEQYYEGVSITRWTGFKIQPFSSRPRFAKPAVRLLSGTQGMATSPPTARRAINAGNLYGWCFGISWKRKAIIYRAASVPLGRRHINRLRGQLWLVGRKWRLRLR